MNRNGKTAAPRRRGMMGYPSAPVADPRAAWSEALREAGPGPRTLYIHIPYCRSRCLFCPFFLGSTDRAGMKQYVALLLRELEQHAPDLSGYPINAVYFGGGTPTDLEPEDLVAILSLLHRRYPLANDCEITLEGRITGFTADKIRACLDHGVNRFSIGVQTFDTGLRRSLGRGADRRRVLDLLRRLGSANQAAVVIDLLYGLPGQTLEQWREDQRIVLNETELSGLDHYHLSVHSGLPLADAVAAGRLPPLPDERQCYEMYLAGEDAMTAAGAVRLSIKHYALDWRERNANNEISGRKNVCLPFGIHAGGRLGRYVFNQTDDPETYRRMVEAGQKPLSRAGLHPPDYAVCAEIAGQISRQRGLHPEKFAAVDPARSERIAAAVAPLLRQWQEKEQLHPAGFGWFRLSREATFRHRSLAGELMEAVARAYADPAAPGGNTP